VNSRQPMNSARNLKGYIIILKQNHSSWGHTPLTLGMSPPSRLKRTWGFDWFHRGTVFRTKAAATEVWKHLHSTDKWKSDIVPLKDYAVLVPEVNSKGKLYFKPESKCNGIPLAERVRARHKTADDLYKVIARFQRKAKEMRKAAILLARQE